MNARFRTRQLMQKLLEKTLIQLFNEYPHLAVFISLALSVLVAVIGILPSVFITAANILFFGFVNGTLLSFAGEALGAAVAFQLYRRGFKKKVGNRLDKYPSVQKLVAAEKGNAFLLIFSLRLVPFVPSGLITFAAAIGKVGFTIFLVASSLGKIPALLMEAFAVNEVTKFGWQGKIILLLAALALIYWVVKKRAA